MLKIITRGGGRQSYIVTNSNIYDLLMIYTFMRIKQEEMGVIRIRLNTKERIETLAKQKDLKLITVLEYLLNGKISLEELK